jgi:hypothetical protein
VDIAWPLPLVCRRREVSMGYLLRENAFDLEERLHQPILAEVSKVFGLSYEIGLILVAIALSPVALIFGWVSTIFVAITATTSETYRSQRDSYRLARVRYAVATGRVVLPPGMTEDEFAARPDAHWIVAEAPNRLAYLRSVRTRCDPVVAVSGPNRWELKFFRPSPTWGPEGPRRASAVDGTDLTGQDPGCSSHP